MPTAYVIEMKVREDWAQQAASQFTKSELDWQVVDHHGSPSHMAYLDELDAIADMPRVDDWYEVRVRDLDGNITVLNPGKPIPPDYVSGDHLRRPLTGVENLTIEQLTTLRREYYQASDGVRAMAATTAREIGERLSVNYGPKYVYAPDDPDMEKFYAQRSGLVIYVDDYGNYMNIYVDQRLVCSTHATNQLFVPGAWVRRIDEVYPDVYAKVVARREIKLHNQRKNLIDELT